MAEQPKAKQTDPQIRPKVLIESVEIARQIVAQRFGAAMASTLGNGDVIDLAMKLIAEDQGLADS